jgi:hypothetical protein
MMMFPVPGTLTAIMQASTAVLFFCHEPNYYPAIFSLDGHDVYGIRYDNNCFVRYVYLRQQFVDLRDAFKKVVLYLP